MADKLPLRIRVRNFFAHTATYMFIGLVRIMPRGMAFSFGRAMGVLGWNVQPRWHHTTCRNLEIMFGDRYTHEERMAIGRESAIHLGFNLIEFIRMRFLPKKQVLAMVVETEGLEHLDAALAQGKGVIALGMHYGNWECCGAWMANYHSLSAVGKDQSDEFFTRLALPWRSRHGIGIIVAGDKVNSAILKVLRKGEVLGLISDQNGGTTGVFADFGGTPASTNQGAAALSMRLKVPAVPIFAKRLAPGKLKVICKPPLDLTGVEGYDEETGKFTDEALVTVLERMNKIYYDILSEDPVQWLWGHKRYRTRPEGEESLY